MSGLRTEVRLIPVIAVFVCGFLLTACEAPPGAPPVLSLEEAKQVTATFEGQAFIPPPKTIKDITAILDQQKPADPQAALVARAAAAAEPSPELSGEGLANFYRKRGIAAKNIGNIKQQLADMRMALRLSADANSQIKMRRLWDVGVAELLGGNYAESMRLREQAIAIVPYKKRGGLIHYRSLIASHYAGGGDMSAAEAHLEAAERLLREARNWRSWQRNGNGFMGQVERARASVLATKGQFRKAEPLFRSAIVHLTRDAEKKNNPYSNVLIESTRGKLAGVLASQGRLVEAEVKARKALINTLSVVGRYSQDTAGMIDRLSKVILSQGRFAEAETLARATLDIYDKIGIQSDSLQLNKARRTLARTLIYQQRWDDALIEYELIRRDLVENPDTFKNFFAADLDWALALLRAGRPAEAETIAFRALERLDKLKKRRFKQAKARALLAQTLAAQGKRKAALENFTAAVPVLISRAKRSDDESETQAIKELQLTMLLEFYIDLLADVRGTELERQAGINAASVAFLVADAARGQSVQRALSASGVRASVDNPELADYARREQDTQKQISTLNTLLADVLSQPSSQKTSETIATLRADIDQLRGAHAALVEEIESRFPDYADLIDPQPATVELARSLLRPGEALISTYVGERHSYIWAVPRQGAVAFHAAALGREDLADTVAWLRSALEPSAQTLGDIPDFDVTMAHDLFAQLLAPVDEGWKASSSLLVVAHGPLGYLPLSVLPTKSTNLAQESGALFSNYRDVPWLARSHAVTMLPSVNSLKTLRGLPPGNENRKAFAGFGDPYFASDDVAKPSASADDTTVIASRGLKTRGLPVRLRAAPQTAALDSADLSALPRLPDTADEIQSIAVALHADLSEDIFLGARASEGLVKSTNLSGYRVLAFATHGLVPGDLDGLAQPALALSAPTVANDPNNDGLLTMGEILGLRLDADWVVLSACNTGTGRGAGAEAVSGLGRAFFYAGTRALLVSNWPVETTSAKILTTDLFRRQAQDAGLSRAEALRQAMLALLDGAGYIDPATGKQVFAYAHPLFWAPFTLIGDGG